MTTGTKKLAGKERCEAVTKQKPWKWDWEVYIEGQSHIGLLHVASTEERHRGKDGGSSWGRWTSRRSLAYAKSFILLMWIGSKALVGHWLPSYLHSHTLSSIQELNGEDLLIHLKSFPLPLASDPPVLQLIGNRLWHESLPFSTHCSTNWQHSVRQGMEKTNQKVLPFSLILFCRPLEEPEN